MSAVRPNHGGARRKCRSRGQALVEFALVIPLFLVAVFAIIEFGWYVYQVQTLNEAAREGTRYAVVHGSTSLCPSGPLPGGAPNWCDPSGAKVQAAVRNYSVGLDPLGLTFPTMSWYPDDGRGSTFTLVVSETFQPLIPWLPLPPITVQGGSSLVVQH